MDGDDPTPRRRFWLRPKWIVGHLLVVVLVVSFVNFGFWQLRRLDERRQANAVVADRGSLPVAPLDDVVPVGADFTDVDDLAYRHVEVEGTYDADASVLVRSRTLNGRPGFWVLTPLLTGDDQAVMVNRGFAPFSAEIDQVLAATRPPSGEVTVSGLLLATQERQGIGPTDPAEGVLAEVSRIDLGRIQQQYEPTLAPGFVQLQTQDPASGPLPEALPQPEQSEGNHQSYAGQWFLFAAVGVVGWPVLLRHTAREERQGSPLDPPLPPVDATDKGESEGEGQERRSVSPSR